MNTCPADVSWPTKNNLLLQEKHAGNAALDDQNQRESVVLIGAISDSLKPKTLFGLVKLYGLIKNDLIQGRCGLGACAPSNSDNRNQNPNYPCNARLRSYETATRRWHCSTILVFAPPVILAAGKEKAGPGSDTKYCHRNIREICHHNRSCKQDDRLDIE